MRIDTGEHISAKIRERYLEACLRQNIAFFDQIGAGEVTTRITADTNLIQDGISEKVGITFAALATFISAFVIGKTVVNFLHALGKKKKKKKRKIISNQLQVMLTDIQVLSFFGNLPLSC